MTKVQSQVILVLRNVRIVPSNVRKKKGTAECDKSTITCDLVLHNMRMVPLNVRKNKGTTKCNKSTVTCDISIVQCEDDTIKYKKKNKGTTKCNKSTVTCDVGIAQCEDNTSKCDKSTALYDVGIAQSEDNTIKYEKKKVTEPPNVIKVQSYVMLVLHNVNMVPLNVRKKIRESSNVTKV